MEKNQTYALRAIEIEKQRLIDNVKSHLEKNNRIELLDQINEAFEKYPSLSEQYCYYVVSCVYGSIDPCSADKFMGT
ncbi:MAG: hypothetical protein JSU85_08675 [Candidatus Zixiibacteriota bacterium]|nr:MAG: hypothetical protein JSU85_08675 [candidate division Zixibacteria bacterium]